MFKKILFATTASPVCDHAAKVAFDLELKWHAQPVRLSCPGHSDPRLQPLRHRRAHRRSGTGRSGLSRLGEGGDAKHLWRTARRERPGRNRRRRGRPPSRNPAQGPPGGCGPDHHGRPHPAGRCRRRPLSQRGGQHHAEGGQGRPLPGGDHQPALHHLLEAFLQHRGRHGFFQAVGIRLSLGLQTGQGGQCQPAHL